MKTVVNINQNPKVFDNDSTIAVINVNSAGTDQASATEIPKRSGHTVALVQVTANNSGVRLPSGASIGDVVEVHNDAGGFFPYNMYPATGESFFGRGPSVASLGLIARKVGATVWAVHGPN